MKLLLVAATSAEIAPLLAHLEAKAKPLSNGRFSIEQLELELCITGVGMMATAYNLTKAIGGNQFHLALQAGVAGSFREDISPGELVLVETEQYGDLGAEDHYNFLDIAELGLLNHNEAPFKAGKIQAPASDFEALNTLRKVSGLSVNTGSGSAFSVTARQDKFHCDIESMEGIAFHYVCSREGIPFAQVRAISNYVTPRDRESWKMKEAIINLNEWLIGFIESL